MPVRKRSVRRRHGELVGPQLWELLLPSGGRGAFASEEERREAWEIHRDQFMKAARHGSRPVGWWDYESPEDRDTNMTQTLQLYRMGELADEELAYARQYWVEQEEAERYTSAVNRKKLAVDAGRLLSGTSSGKPE